MIEVVGEIVQKADWAFLSASGLERGENCSWAYALPEDPQEDRSGDDATRGTAIHAFLERHLLGVPRGENLALCPDEVFEVCAGIDLAKIPPALAEIAWAIDVQTWQVRVLTRTEHRDYGPLGEFEIPGTMDFGVSPLFNRHVPMTGDWKTGYDSVPMARTSLQGAFHAVGIDIVASPPAVDVAVVRLDDVGVAHWDVARLDRTDLEQARFRIAKVVEAVHNARRARQSGEAPEVTPGAHCKWCPSKGSCPAYANESRGIELYQERWIDSFKGQLAANDNAAFWYEKLKRAQTVIEAMQAAVNERIEHAPVTLSDGSVVARVTESRRRIDGKVALKVIEEHLGEDIAKACAKVSISAESIKKAAGPAAASVLKLLDQAGARSSYDVTTTRVAKAGSRRRGE